jgi:hypothetical protein
MCLVMRIFADVCILILMSHVTRYCPVRAIIYLINKIFLFVYGIGTRLCTYTNIGHLWFRTSGCCIPNIYKLESNYLNNNNNNNDSYYYLLYLIILLNKSKLLTYFAL